MYDLPSWGRCELALSLLLEENAPYSLEDVVQAVRESHDREFIKRVLTKECPICLSIFPHSKVTAPSHQSASHQRKKSWDLMGKRRGRNRNEIIINVNIEQSKGCNDIPIA